VWFATPLLQRTFTSYSLPVSRRTVSKDEGAWSVRAANPSRRPLRGLLRMRAVLEESLL
jgi:hypothetical protein